MTDKAKFTKEKFWTTELDRLESLDIELNKLAAAMATHKLHVDKKNEELNEKYNDVKDMIFKSMQFFFLFLFLLFLIFCISKAWSLNIFIFLFLLFRSFPA